MTQNKRVKRKQYLSKYTKPSKTFATYMNEDKVWMRIVSRRRELC
jgi:hypothetical protein